MTPLPNITGSFVPASSESKESGHNTGQGAPGSPGGQSGQGGGGEEAEQDMEEKSNYQCTCVAFEHPKYGPIPAQCGAHMLAGRALISSQIRSAVICFVNLDDGCSGTGIPGDLVTPLVERFDIQRFSDFSAK